MSAKVMAPLVLFVYRRVDKTDRLLKKINELAEAAYTPLVIFSDAAKTESAVSDVEIIRRIIGEFKKESKFYSIEIVSQSDNKGLANSIIDGVTEVINRYGKVIVLEDDLRVSSDFLKFMNESLAFYENKNVWAISGYSEEVDAIKSYPHDIYMSEVAHSWGWATWKNRWNTIDWSVSSYNHFKFNLLKRKQFASWFNFFPEMLDWQVYGLIDSWAIRFVYEGWRSGKYVVYPVKSRVQVDGNDIAATHFRDTDSISWYTELNDLVDNIRYEMLDISPDIKREVHQKYYRATHESLKMFLVKMGVLPPKYLRMNIKHEIMQKLVRK